MASGNDVIPYMGAAVLLQIILLAYPISTASWLRRARASAVISYVLATMLIWVSMGSGILTGAGKKLPWLDTLGGFYALLIGIPLAVSLGVAAIRLVWRGPRQQ
jgi:hypothetical protein